MDFYLFFFLFVFHKEFLVISHNFNDQVYTIIIAQPNLDNQIGAIERVDINPQPLKIYERERGLFYLDKRHRQSVSRRLEMIPLSPVSHIMFMSVGNSRGQGCHCLLLGREEPVMRSEYDSTGIIELHG